MVDISNPFSATARAAEVDDVPTHQHARDALERNKREGMALAVKARIIALGVTQVIISGGIDLSSGPLVGATAMIVMSFAQTEFVNGNPNPKAVFTWAFDLPVILPVIVGLMFGALIGAINGSLIAYTRIPPFIATLGMFLICRGIAQAWTRGQPVSFPTESLG